MSTPQTLLGPLLPLPAITPPPNRPVTSAGLPYPTPQDSVCDIDLFIHELADAIDYRLNNRALLMGQPVLTSDANGHAVITIPAFTTVQGIVAQPFANQPNGTADVWYITATCVALMGNQATVRLWRTAIKREGYLTAPFVGSYPCSVFAWGVPK